MSNLRQNLVRKYGFFGAFWRLILEFLVTPAVFYAIAYIVLYFAVGWPEWWLPLAMLVVGGLCYRSMRGINRQFFTVR